MLINCFKNKGIYNKFMDLIDKLKRENNNKDLYLLFKHIKMP